jgi:acetoin utilization protein AcuB
MREHDIRHLPVFDAGRLVGVISERDIILVESLADVNPTEVNVEEAMTTDVYVVEPDTSLLETVGTMIDRKLGSAIVAEGTRVVGVFTTIDALRALVERLR